MKKTEKTKLDKLWREAIHGRDKFCQKGGHSSTRFNAHHIIGRRNLNLRWILDNGILLCPLCHTFGTVSAHQDPAEFIEWFKEEYPERYEHITSLRYDTTKHDFDYWKNYILDNT